MARAVLLLRHAHHRVSMVFMKHNNYIQLFLHGIDHHLTSVLFSSGFALDMREESEGLLSGQRTRGSPVPDELQTSTSL